MSDAVNIQTKGPYGCARFARFTREVCTLTPYGHVMLTRFTCPGVCCIFFFFFMAGLGLTNIHIKESAFSLGLENYYYYYYFFKHIIFTSFCCHSLWHKLPDHRVMQYKVMLSFPHAFFSVKRRENSVAANFTCSRYERRSSELKHLLDFFFFFFNTASRRVSDRVMLRTQTWNSARRDKKYFVATQTFDGSLNAILYEKAKNFTRINYKLNKPSS